MIILSLKREGDKDIERMKKQKSYSKEVQLWKGGS